MRENDAGGVQGKILLRGWTGASSSVILVAHPKTQSPDWTFQFPAHGPLEHQMLKYKSATNGMEWFCAEIGGSWDGQGSTLEAGSFFYSIIDDTGYLDEATIAAFPAGTADIEVRRFNPSSDNLVNNGLMGVLSISGPKEYKNYTSFSGFDKALTAGDVVRFMITGTPADITQLSLKVQRSRWGN